MVVTRIKISTAIWVILKTVNFITLKILRNNVTITHVYNYFDTVAENIFRVASRLKADSSIVQSTFFEIQSGAQIEEIE